LFGSSLESHGVLQFPAPRPTAEQAPFLHHDITTLVCADP
jgi:hypothetical protein